MSLVVSGSSAGGLVLLSLPVALTVKVKFPGAVGVAGKGMGMLAPGPRAPPAGAGRSAAGLVFLCVAGAPKDRVKGPGGAGFAGKVGGILAPAWPPGGG